MDINNMYQFDSSKHNFSEYGAAIAKIIGGTFIAYALTPFLIFGLRHPYMTEIEYYYYTKEELTFQKIDYEQVEKWRKSK